MSSSTGFSVLLVELVAPEVIVYTTVVQDAPTTIVMESVDRTTVRGGT